LAAGLFGGCATDTADTPSPGRADQTGQPDITDSVEDDTAPGPPAPQQPPAPNALAVYQGEFPTASGAGRTVRFEMYGGGNAWLISEYAGEPEPIVERGFWEVEDDYLIFRLAEDPADPYLIWSFANGALEPEEWDRTHYGSEGLPLERLN
ncbi:MAG: hypothetical protein ACLFV4_10015, partial [Candidatus Hydrogenedentota bacterium]